MTHVSLDLQDAAIQRFVLDLAADPFGSVLEMEGQPVACIVPTPRPMNGTATVPEWNDARNARRVTLIQKKHAAGLSPSEHVELVGLQDDMLRFRQKIAPLPLDDARRLHQELLARVASQTIQE